MKKRGLVLVILSIFLIFSMTALISCGDTSVKITYDACGGAFSNGDGVLTLEKQAGSLLVQPVSPTKKGAVFVGWSTTEDGSEFWDFNSDRIESGTTLYAVWQTAEAKIVTVTGGELVGDEISVSVDRATSSLNLSDMFVVSDYASWVLCRDSAGTDVISNKKITNLLLGDNTYYIVVTAKDGVASETYTLKVFKDNTVVVTLNANGGTLTHTEKIIAYGESFTLPVPTREGHIFLGWMNNDSVVTDDEGKSVFASSIAEATTLTAAWRKKEYTVTLATSSDTNMGNVSGTGKYEYGQSVTVYATAKQGYRFVGWYDDEGVLVSNDVSYTLTISGDVSLVARFEISTGSGGNVDNNGWTGS